MTLPSFPNQGSTNWYAWAQGVHDAVEDGASDTGVAALVEDTNSATAVALRAAFGAQAADAASPLRTELHKVFIGADDVPAATLATGRRVAYGIDSHTVGTGASNATVDAYVPMVSKILGTARLPQNGTFARINAGIGGNTVAQFIARMETDVFALDPDMLVFLGGTNASTDLATFQAGVAQVHARCREAGIPMVLCTIPPRGAGTSDTTQHDRTRTYNLFLRSYATRNGLPQPDLYAALVDPATGFLQTAYNVDETHLTPAGHAVAAQTIAAVLDTLLPASAIKVVAPGAPGLMANPLNAGGTASTSPTGWTAAQAGTGTIVRGTEAPAGGDPITAVGGTWYKINIDNTAGGSSSTDVRYQALSGSHLTGDKILYTYCTKSSAADGSGTAVQLAAGTTVLATTSFTGVQKPGRMASVVTLAADATNLRLRLSVTAAAGATQAGYIGEVQAWNLTQLGLADQF